ncbi:MAG: zinc-dependent dehydrogenase [Candidatus Omnitrophota bacterium]
MRVAMYYSNKDVRVEEAKKPEIGKGEILVRVIASGLCGTDVMEWYRIKKAPLVLGHEIAGEVAAVGEEVRDFKVGDRVSASHHVPCNTCHYCLRGHHTVCDTLRETKFFPGGFSEFVRVPSIHVDRGVYALPDNISYEEATFIEPLACIVRGQRAAGARPGDTVCVLGSGISGLLHVKLAKAKGASAVVATDVVDYRLRFALASGADRALPGGADVAAELRAVTGGRLADIVIVCTGAKDANTAALSYVERGGTVLFFASGKEDIEVAASINDLFWRNEITLTSSYAGSPDDHREALALIADGTVKVRDLITHRVCLKDAAIGFQLVAQAQDSIKVIIEPQK